MRNRIPGPLCGYKLGTAWIDDGIMCLSRSSPPGPLGSENGYGLLCLNFFVCGKRTGKSLTDASYKLTLENSQEILRCTDQIGFTETVSAGAAIMETLEVFPTMATVRSALTPAGNRAPVVIEVPAKELSGPAWVARFPTSVAVGDLKEPFQSNVNSFLAAISVAGGTVTISATYRPVERAYLMHYSSKLSKKEIAANKIPAASGVNIEWVHDTEVKSVTAASAMANAYGIAYPPALVSNHTRRTAIDMTIGNMVGKRITDAQGVVIAVKKLSDLHAVGASFGVIKLVSDPPHWSNDGH